MGLGLHIGVSYLDLRPFTTRVRTHTGVFVMLWVILVERNQTKKALLSFVSSEGEDIFISVSRQGWCAHVCFGPSRLSQ